MLKMNPWENEIGWIFGGLETVICIFLNITKIIFTSFFSNVATKKFKIMCLSVAQCWFRETI